MEPTCSFAGAFDVPPGTRFRGHGHEGVHLCAVRAGGFAESLGRHTELAAAGVLRLSPSARHDIRFGPDGARCLLVEVGPDDAAALRRLPRNSAFILDPWLSELARRLDRAIASEPSAASDLVLEMLAQVARRELGRKAGPPPAWLVRVRDRLADESRHPPSANTLAFAEGVHRVHLVRSFRDHFGCTLRGYVRRRRVMVATRLLQLTDLPLSHVAAEAGFADQAHLSRTLRSATGVTPLALRRSGRGLARGLPGFNTSGDRPA
jgi:AraC-like DNA-binding protein